MNSEWMSMCDQIGCACTPWVDELRSRDHRTMSIKMRGEKHGSGKREEIFKLN